MTIHADGNNLSDHYAISCQFNNKIVNKVSTACSKKSCQVYVGES